MRHITFEALDKAIADALAQQTDKLLEAVALAVRTVTRCARLRCLLSSTLE